MLGASELFWGVYTKIGVVESGDDFTNLFLTISECFQRLIHPLIEQHPKIVRLSEAVGTAVL
ncbi:MAG: hypothetical protein HRU34_04335 [Richelia sp.]|nr:hypothetical protein [Richelia sp.]CDN13968.1 hypothetical protein RintRC_3043 [Richelia intracellularis]